MVCNWGGTYNRNIRWLVTGGAYNRNIRWLVTGGLITGILDGL